MYLLFSIHAYSLRFPSQEVLGYVEMYIFLLNLYLQPYIDNDCVFYLFYFDSYFMLCALSFPLYL
jgi:hypothetical protein